jgi:non-ribosomal peptide synthase protein (TIGR01720 family)
MEAVACRHDMLRAVYRDGVQHVPEPEDSPLCKLQIVDRRGQTLDPAEAEAIHAAMQKQVNLSEGPLFRATLIRTDEGDHLTLCIHHLVVDGVSWRILLADLFSAYRQAERGEEIFLPAKTAPFRAWAERLWEYAETESLLAELPYWQAALTEGKQNDLRPVPSPEAPDESAGRRCPADGRHPSDHRHAWQDRIVPGNDPEEDRLTIRIPVHTTNAILYEAGVACNAETLPLLLSALSIAVFHWTGQTKICVEMEGHGREELHVPIQVDRTVGWFTSVWPLTLPCHPDPGQIIHAVKDRLSDVPGHGIGYGLLESHLHPGAEKPWRPAICFNYLGQMDEPIFEGALAPSALSAGPDISEKNRLPNAISIQGGIRAGALTLEIHFDQDQWRRQSIRAFADAYARALASVADHCRAAVRTDTRFGLNDMEEDELLEIQELFS